LQYRQVYWVSCDPKKLCVRLSKKILSSSLDDHKNAAFSKLNSLFKKLFSARHRWLTLVLLAPWEAEIRFFSSRPAWANSFSKNNQSKIDWNVV
jgi:hypothetical protein